jgi:hypothetical protein
MKWDEDENETQRDARRLAGQHRQQQQQQPRDSPVFSSIGDKSIDCPRFPVQVRFNRTFFCKPVLLILPPPHLYHLCPPKYIYSPVTFPDIIEHCICISWPVFTLFDLLAPPSFPFVSGLAGPEIVSRILATVAWATAVPPLRVSTTWLRPQPTTFFFAVDLTGVTGMVNLSSSRSGRILADDMT